MKIKHETSAGGVVFKLPEGFEKKPEIERIEWLVIQHSGHKGWTFPKGLIGDHDPTEDKKTAALREVKEEGGIEAEIADEEPVESRYSYKWQDTLVKKTVYYYLMKYKSGNPEDHDWEVEKAEFLKTPQVLERLTFKSDKEVFEKMLEKLKKIFNSQ